MLFLSLAFALPQDAHSTDTHSMFGVWPDWLSAVIRLEAPRRKHRRSRTCPGIIPLLRHCVFEPENAVFLDSRRSRPTQYEHPTRQFDRTYASTDPATAAA